MLSGEVLAFAIGAGAGLAATVAIVPAARRIGFVAGFNPIVPQVRPPAALGGGLGILAGVALALGFAEWLVLVVADMSIVVAAVPALVLGLADDARAMTPKAKLPLQFLCAGVGTVMLLGLPLDLHDLMWGALAVFGAAVLMNAFNFLDVSDGYAAGIAVVSFAGFAILTSQGVNSAAVSGACLGFLLLNRPPARIYMGDAGSHLLGMLGAILVMDAAREMPVASAIGAGAACFAVPLLELVGVTAIRWWEGNSIWRGSSDHSALRLQRAGLSKMQSALGACLAQFVLFLGYWLATGQ